MEEGRAGGRAVWWRAGRKQCDTTGVMSSLPHHPMTGGLKGRGRGLWLFSTTGRHSLSYHLHYYC